MGDSHGGIAVSPAGEIYVSVQAAIMPASRSTVPAAIICAMCLTRPPIHGFIITRGRERQAYTFGVSRLAQQIVQIRAGRQEVLHHSGEPRCPTNIRSHAAASRPPTSPASRWRPMATLCHDGYGLDSIHRFDEQRAISPVSAARARVEFQQPCHRIAIDTAYAGAPCYAATAATTGWCIWT